MLGMSSTPALPPGIVIAGEVALQEYEASGAVDREFPWGSRARSIGRVLVPGRACGLTVHVTGEAPDLAFAPTKKKQYLLLYHKCKLFKSLELPYRRVRPSCTERLSKLPLPHLVDN